MEKELNENKIIEFNELSNAAAHARLIFPECKWIAVDADKLIFEYKYNPSLDQHAPINWIYHIDEWHSGIQPFGYYTGTIPWINSLTRVR
jgi:hypothetical protein